MKIFLVLCSILCVSSAQAEIDRTLGEWGSGGGNALVCFKQKTAQVGGSEVDINIAEKIRNSESKKIPDKYLEYIESIEMFDLYEAKKRRGIDSPQPEIIKINDDEKYYDYFDRLAKRYDKRVYRMLFVLETAKTLIPDTRLIFHDFPVEHQNDLGSVALPSNNCVVATMAAQVNYNDFYEVHIDERLFNHPTHSKQSKATLILHELLYAVGRKTYDHKDSGATRNLVRYFISYHNSITEGEVSKALLDLKFYATGAVDPESRHMAQYDNSDITLETISQIKNAQHNIAEHTSDTFKSLENKELLKIILDQGKKDSYSLEGMIDSLESQTMILEWAISNGRSTQAWREIYNKFDKIYNLLLIEIQNSVKLNLTYLRESLTDELYTTEEDTRNILGKFNNYFDEIIMELSDSKFNIKRYENIQSVENIEKEITYFQIMFSMTSCSVTMPPISIEAKSIRNPEVCFYPIKLNNIIPKS